MGSNRLVSSRPRYNATRSASDFAGIARDGGVWALFPNTSVFGSTTNLDARGEERLAERTRIAQELHDTLLQGFFAVSMQLHAAVDHLPADSAAKPRFSSVLQLLDRVLEQGRCALQGLRSPNERTASLGEAFARVPNDLGFPSATGFRVVVLGKEKELRAGVRDEVYRIGCEAIINACRHSRARDIEMEVEYRPTELRIAVRDIGCGIDPQDLQWGRKGHWGLQGMRERAERIGARLRVCSRVALGTEVELCVPGRVAFEQTGVPSRLLNWSALARDGREYGKEGVA
jgi:signal transduction histidine kinase